MSSTITKTPSQPPPHKRLPFASVTALRVTAYDRVASMVISLLMLVGAGVLFLIVAWFSSGLFHYEQPVPVALEEFSGGGYKNGIGTEGQKIEAPTESEVAAESELPPDATNPIAAVINVTTSIADLDKFEPQFAPLERPQTGGLSTGHGKHPANGRNGGNGGGDRKESEWEIRFPPGNTVETYAKQLTFFGIELGVFDGASEVVYVTRLTQEKPASRSSPRSAENRKYMTWSRGDLDQADQELFDRAGVKVDGRQIFKFLPPDLESKLVGLERSFKNKEPKDIRKTRFGVKADGANWQFYVIEQTFY